MADKYVSKDNIKEILSEVNNKISERIVNELYETSVYETVDLGLPSGLLWAACNIGATKPEESGLYFQWGDTQGYKGACTEAESTDDNKETHYFDWSKYKYCDGSNKVMSKYCTNINYGTVDNKIVLDSEDDAATVLMGSDWRIPTAEEFRELMDNTVPGDGTEFPGWIKNYNGTGINGLLRKSKTNNNTIFFPASGYCNRRLLYSPDNYFYYWSSSLASNNRQNEGFTASDSSWDTYWNERSLGLTVRGVTMVAYFGKNTTKYVPRAEYQSLDEQKFISVESVDNLLSALSTAMNGTWKRVWDDATNSYKFEFEPGK